MKKPMHISLQISDDRDIVVGISQAVTVEFAEGKWTVSSVAPVNGRFLWTVSGEHRMETLLKWLTARLGLGE